MVYNAVMTMLLTNALELSEKFSLLVACTHAPLTKRKIFGMSASHCHPCRAQQPRLLEESPDGRNYYDTCRHISTALVHLVALAACRQHDFGHT